VYTFWLSLVNTIGLESSNTDPEQRTATDPGWVITALMLLSSPEGIQERSTTLLAGIACPLEFE
jgi:hypothetical protein